MKNFKKFKDEEAAEQAAKIIHHNYMEDLGALQQFESANISSFTFELKGRLEFRLHM